MPNELQQDLEAAIQSNMSLEDIVKLLRQYKANGVGQSQVYSILETLRNDASDEATEDRILVVADFVAGFCSPHMKIWDK